MRHLRLLAATVGAAIESPAHGSTLPDTQTLVDELFRFTEHGRVCLGGVTVDARWLRDPPEVRVGGNAVTLEWQFLTLTLDSSVLGAFGMALLSGDWVDIGDGRRMQLPAACPVPELIQVGQKIRVVWREEASVSDGKRVAVLRGIDVYRDHAVVDVEYKRFGIDLARDPVIRWGR